MQVSDGLNRNITLQNLDEGEEQMKKILMYFLLFMVLLIGFLALMAEPIETPDVLKDITFANIAHRGGEALAPENTLVALERGLIEGADILEIDVHLTKDGEVVLFHDEYVDRVTDGKGRIEDLTLAEVKELDAGYFFTRDGGQTYPYRGQGVEIALLTEVFAAFPEAKFSIEMKTYSQEMVEALVDIIKEYQMEDRVLVASFDDKTIKSFRKLMPEVPTSMAEREVLIFYIVQLLHLEFLYTPPAEAAQVPEYSGSIHVVTPRFLEAAHNRGMKVSVWTVNEEEDMHRLKDLGVDGLITDYPNRLNELLGR